MRVEGSLRLVLNARLWPNLKVEKSGDKAARFAAPSLEKPNELCSYLIRAARPENISDFIEAIDANRGIGDVNNKTLNQK